MKISYRLGYREILQVRWLNIRHQWRATPAVVYPILGLLLIAPSALTCINGWDDFRHYWYIPLIIELYVFAFVAVFMGAVILIGTLINAALRTLWTVEIQPELVMRTAFLYKQRIRWKAVRYIEEERGFICISIRPSVLTGGFLLVIPPSAFRSAEGEQAFLDQASLYWKHAQGEATAASDTAWPPAPKAPAEEISEEISK